jgi:hypothetical protein
MGSTGKIRYNNLTFAGTKNQSLEPSLSFERVHGQHFLGLPFDDNPGCAKILA